MHQSLNKFENKLEALTKLTKHIEFLEASRTKHYQLT